MTIKSEGKCPTVAARSGFRSSARRVVLWSSDINMGGRRVNGRSSGLHPTPSLGPLYLLLNLFASRTRTLGRRYRSGLLPYPRSMSSSLASKWIEVRVKRRLKLTLLWLLLSPPNGCQLLGLRLRFSRLDRFRNDRLVL